MHKRKIMKHGDKGRMVNIPFVIAEKLNLQPGDKVAIYINDDNRIEIETPNSGATRKQKAMYERLMRRKHERNTTNY